MRKQLAAWGGALVVLTSIAWVRLLPKIQEASVYRRDFAQLYLMARAARAGTPIYEPLPDLATKFNAEIKVAQSHPSAYPPLIAVLIEPLSLLPYREAFIVWAGIETVCFLAAFLLIFIHFQQSQLRLRILIVSTSFTLWWPFFVDLYQGQVMMLALLLLTGCWVTLRKNRDVVGGLLLGFLIALKFYAWPVWIFLLISKRYRATVAASLVFLVVNILAILWLGTLPTRDYVLYVAPSISRIYWDHPLNFSAFSIGASNLGLSGGVVLAGFVLCLALVMARKSRCFDYSFLIMLTAAAILSPVSWVHYFVTFLPVMCLMACDPSRRSVVVVGLLCTLSVADASYFTPYLSPSVLRWFPLIFTVALMSLLYLRSRQSKPLPKTVTTTVLTVNCVVSTL